MAKRPELLITTGPLSGKRFTVPKEGLRLGRSSSNDIQIPDEGLSRNHCLFEARENEELAVVDLMSANGTYVNGETIGEAAKPLKAGDVVEVGETLIRIAGEEGPVDLGLGSAATTSPDAKPAAAESAKPRAPHANLLWILVAAVMSVSIALVLLFPRGKAAERPVAAASDATEPTLRALCYEKVEADATRIFRYQMTIDAEGMLRVVYDDVPGENRHADKSGRLSPRALERIGEILRTNGWDELEPAYTGASAVGENALKSWRIRTVVGTQVREVLVENTAEPESFAQVRDALEAFSQNELGIWALQYSREKLIALSVDAVRLGDAKWEERDVEYGNLSAAVKSFKEAIFYLDTVNPKPADYSATKEKLAAAERELARRYKDQRFLADKAINLGDWETAKGELRVLCDLVPEKDDARHAEANAKLVDVENRIKRAKKGGRK